MPQQLQQVVPSPETANTLTTKVRDDKNPETEQRLVGDNGHAGTAGKDKWPVTEVKIDSDVKVDRFIEENSLQLAIIRSLEVTKSDKSGTSETRMAKKVTEVKRDLKALTEGSLYQQLSQELEKELQATAGEQVELIPAQIKKRTLESSNSSDFPINTAGAGQEFITELEVNYRDKNWNQNLAKGQERETTNSYSKINKFEKDRERYDSRSDIQDILGQLTDLERVLTEAGDHEGEISPAISDLETIQGERELTSSPPGEVIYRAEEQTTTGQEVNLQLNASKEIPTSELGPITSQEYLAGDNKALILNYDLDSPDNDSQIETRLVYKNQGQNRSLLSSLEATAVDFGVEYSTGFDAMYVNQIGGSEEKDGRFIEFYKNGDIIQNSIDEEEVTPGDLIEARLSEEQRCYNPEIVGQGRTRATDRLENLDMSTELAL